MRISRTGRDENMKSIVKLLFGIAVLCAPLAASANAQETLKAQVISYGVFTSKFAAKDDKNRRDVVKDEKLVSQTATIVAKIGTEFGFTFQIDGAPKGKEVELRVLTKFPPKGIKDEQNDTLFETESRIVVRAGEASYEGFQFESQGELVPGEWSFALYAGETRLAERKFNVVLK